ncbi:MULTISPECIES: hypothetical protein [unclassified Streptomyces]|uniref:hypothetical protein n=1 Tax=unclassified Streptomyces TaxID=2593676 RepID=UPI001368986B|nr:MULTISPECIES: hypothetical protein [unclassified Streptomyces]MCW5252403.1 hypothetical protein [Streptomyces sp. SHP 1-2]MYU21850.1 hypothetical protein [Streptomyces sp. SID8352]
MTTEPLVPLHGGWETLARGWARRRGARATTEQGGLNVDILTGRPTRKHTVGLTPTGRTLVLIITDGTLVTRERLAATAAAATAWNAREVNPTAVLGYDRTELLLLSAVSTLPLAAHMAPTDFAATLNDLLERATRLLSECGDLGRILPGGADQDPRR